MNRNCGWHTLFFVVLICLESTFAMSLSARSATAAVSASIVPGTLSQGSVSGSLLGGSYATETNNLGDWPLDTGSFGDSIFAIGLTNANFNEEPWGGGTPNTMVAFGNSGGVTLQFSQPLRPVDGQKEFGIFTAQGLNSFGSIGAFFNGNMEAAILVSADNVNWFTLSGDAVASPETYTATSHKMNAPTMAYNYQTSSVAVSSGFGTDAASLSALNIADYTTPMPNDDLFNGSGTDEQRLALLADGSEANYDAIFGNSGGGNWFDISLSGLSQVNYLRLNGVNTDIGIRLDAVFANAIAIPEPTGLTLLLLGCLPLLRRCRQKARMIEN